MRRRYNCCRANVDRKVRVALVIVMMVIRGKAGEWQPLCERGRGAGGEERTQSGTDLPRTGCK